MTSAATEMGIFERVVERGSFAGAAEDVGLSPSAVAKLITRLELRLGVRLINRTTRRLALTAEGETYLGRVREILVAIQAAESEVTSARMAPSGHLRVHTFPVIAEHLSPALPDFLARHPQITFDFMVTNRIVDVIGENMDVSLRIGPLNDFELRCAQDRRSHPSRLCKPEVPCPARPAGRAVRSCSTFVSDSKPSSRLGELAVSRQRQDLSRSMSKDRLPPTAPTCC